MRRLFGRTAIAFAIASVLVSCGPGGSVVSVTIVGGDRVLVTDDVVTLVATVTTTGSASAAVSWTASNPTVATVDDSGLLQVLDEGTTEVTATSSDPAIHDTIVVTVEPVGQLRRTLQLGGVGNDGASAVAVDGAGNVYVAGDTGSDLDGTNQGGDDAFVRSYAADGTLRWTRQFGTSTNEDVWDVAVTGDGTLVVGSTNGTLEGTSSGGYDAFVRSYAGNGDLRWTRQFGTASNDHAYAVAIDDDGHIYVAGMTDGALSGQVSSGGFDSYVRSFDSSGNERWTRQFGTSGSDYAQALATDAEGSVFVGGRTNGTLEGLNAGLYDAYVRSYDADGVERWTVQYGTFEWEYVYEIVVDEEGHLYVAGNTEGPLAGSNAGGVDVYVRSLENHGAERWTEQFGTSSNDDAYGMARDAYGNLFVVGSTYGALEGASAGTVDAFVRSLNRDGQVRWTRQFGTSSADRGYAVATDGTENVHVVGQTGGDLAGSQGSFDGFVRTFGR